MSLQTSLKVAYPAIFHPEECGGYFIEFPDVQGAYTGINENDIAYGLLMAEEVLGMVLADYIENNETLPKASELNSISHKPDEFVTMVLVDIEEYFKDMKPVKKTLTIPSWANNWGNRVGINFSQLLTESIAQTAINYTQETLKETKEKYEVKN
ncbi:TPA: type II toxin-antitoxin system HicB family antitoxin [Enterococcus faecalis]|nr:type II toxin-antitoxin system HicB family antitoxin [Enterococcus faecalis]